MAIVGDPIEHGTYKGYRQHRRRGETPCADCRQANNSYERERRLIGPKPPRALKPCGTRAAWTRHRKRGEQPCDDCKRAAGAASVEARRRRRGVREPSVPVPDLPGETWLPIPDAPGYEVSDLGRVKSVDRYVERRGFCCSAFPEHPSRVPAGVVVRCACPPDPQFSCDRCDGRIDGLESFLTFGPDFEPDAADVAADEYERALWAALGGP